jgi:aminoglycoside 3-N-acetyltransferase
MLTPEDFKVALDGLELENKPAIAHASLKSFGAIQGGAETVLNALLASVSRLIVPTFTYKTMITPEVGPPNNGIAYGTQLDLNRMSEPFRYDMSVDPLIGTLPETLRHYPGAMRTAHPILSFAGVNATNELNTQTVYNPFTPIGALADQDGWVLLMGVNHTVNTSIHYGERLAGRHQFVRWAMSNKRIVECPGFPGCSDGFEAIRPEIKQFTRRVEVGNSFIEAVPLHPMLQVVEASIKKNPQALLCQREMCERCDAVRVTET